MPIDKQLKRFGAYSLWLAVAGALITGLILVLASGSDGHIMTKTGLRIAELGFTPLPVISLLSGYRWRRLARSLERSESLPGRWAVMVGVVFSGLQILFVLFIVASAYTYMGLNWPWLF